MAIQSLLSCPGWVVWECVPQKLSEGAGEGGGFGMTPWCDDLVCSWRRLLADRHSLPFNWTPSLHGRWCPSASHHPLTFLFLLALTFPLPSPFPYLGLSLCGCMFDTRGGGVSLIKVPYMSMYIYTYIYVYIADSPPANPRFLFQG